jgi:plastocyanin
MRKPITAIAATGVLALGIAACGGSSSHASAAAGTTAATNAASVVPASSSAVAARSRLTISAAKSGALMFSTMTLKAKAGTVTITFINHSPEGHNLTVVHGANGAKVGATPTFEGGSKTLTLHLTAGRYTYFCSVPGHRQAGMQGTLTVS